MEKRPLWGPFFSKNSQNLYRYLKQGAGGCGIMRLKLKKEVEIISKLELVAEIGTGQIEIVQVYLKGLLSAAELEQLIGKRKTSMVSNFTTEYADV